MSIVVTDLTHTYAVGTPMSVDALRGVTLTVDDGEFVGIVGAMGAGKSTLMQHMNGLILPPPGAVVVDGLDVGAKGTDLLAVRQRVGFVFQYPEQQLFGESVFADVAFGPRNIGLDEDQVLNRVADALLAVGLDLGEFKHRSPFGLSGGQQRRVALAGVLAMQPRYLILDEPTAGLDPRGRRDLLQLLTRLHEQQGMAVVLVSHNMEDVARLAQKVIVLDAGQVAMQGTPREVLSATGRESLLPLGLDVPVAAQLIAGLTERGWPLPADIVAEEDVIKAVVEAARSRV